MPKFAIAGSGFSGAVLARELVESSDCQVLVFDERNHLGGNCHTERDAATGVMLHTYGAHIFNTNNQDVWRYVHRFSDFMPFLNRVKASIERGIFSFPVNLHTINQFFGKRFSPIEAKEFIESMRIGRVDDAENLEDLALASMGKDLYEAFFYGYTRKQWGCEPRELPASILKRIPLRFSYDDNYYSSRYQGMPLEGYTRIIERILSHDRISLVLNCSYEREMNVDFDHVFYTGAIDRYFEFCSGRLPYRTLDWIRNEGEGNMQGVAVINYPELAQEFTRILEPKHFAPWESHERSVLFEEYSREMAPNDIPYYPKRLSESLRMLGLYVDRASDEPNVSFLGRLGTYRYLNMDQVIEESLRFAKQFLDSKNTGVEAPRFSSRPV